MHKGFWLERWNRGRTGFHRDQPMPMLLEHWPGLHLPSGSRVLVPLAGKSLDMIWLAAQGHEVLGVEISPLAIEQFLAENQLQSVTRESAIGVHHVAGNIELVCGDAFLIDDANLASCDAIYDRAAIIALPAAMRKHYVNQVYARLRSGCRGLMIALEYKQGEMDGPPFSVTADEIQRLLAGSWKVRQLERRQILDSQPQFREQGLSSLHAAVYALERN